MTARVAILGATGSVGRTALEVISRHPDRFRVAVLSAHRAAAELDRLALACEPDRVVLSGAEPPPDPAWRGRWATGPEALSEACRSDGVDIVLNALVGFAGLSPTLATLEAGKRLALANKESLVAGGELVMAAHARGGGELLPVDSEHSGVHQCLAGRPTDDVRRVTLTASGGPFREASLERIAAATPEDALAHPTWDMGAKITIDSATLANKALEVIEAHVLFGLPYDRIHVAVHPGSIVHALVQFRDGSTIAQLGYPSMESPVLYALAWPDRLEDGARRFDPVEAGPLEFHEVRRDAFPMFGLGVAAGRAGGTAPAVYNAANEIAVAAFLQREVSFGAIARVVQEVLDACPARSVDSIEDVRSADEAARSVAAKMVRRHGTSASRPGETGRSADGDAAEGD